MDGHSLDIVYLPAQSRSACGNERGLKDPVADAPECVTGIYCNKSTHTHTQPVILDASLSLILSLVAKQLPIYHSHLSLVTTILRTLARLATVAQEAAGSELNSVPEDIFPTYTPLQVCVRVCVCVCKHFVPRPLRELRC